MVAAKSVVRKGVRPSADDDIDSYLEAQLVADISSAKTREVPKASMPVKPKRLVAVRAAVEEAYDATVDDCKLPDN